MTSLQQRAELHRQIWAIANDVRGSVDGWDFKQYVLGALFYRFISENFASYMNAGDESVNYEKMDDSVIPDDSKDDAVRTKGYFIYPSQLFSNVAAKANTNDRLNADLNSIFVAIESSAYGYPSEPDIKGLFADFDTTSNRLGNTVKDKNSRLAAVLKGVEGLKLGNFDKHQIDLFGDAYEFLISNYAANAGKSGGEFFTPQHVSKLIAQLAMHGQKQVNKIYDPAAGSGSLLLQAKKHFDNHIIEDGFFGQEINHTTFNLARMNMFLHNINYDKFNIKLGNTLLAPEFKDDKPFDAIVSNPPYSVKWIGSDDPTLINDERFAPAGVLAPKSKADFAFVLHALNYLSSKGRAAIVCFPGIFYRGGAEQKIRQYLVDNNYVETVISLAPNLFFGTTIAVNILVLSKHKTETSVQFIDAITLFGKSNTRSVVMEKSYDEYMEGFTDTLTGEARRGFTDIVSELETRFPKPADIESEKEKKAFVKLFGEYLRVENILQNYDEFTTLKALQTVDLSDPVAVETFKTGHYLDDEAFAVLQTVRLPAERKIQDYRSSYNDIREWQRRERDANTKDKNTVDWDDVVFEVDLLKSQEINLDYILGLIYEHHQKSTDKETLKEEVKRLIRASLGNRAKEGLMVDFIEQTSLDDIPDKEGVIEAFYTFAQQAQQREADALIKEESLNEEAARRYIRNSLKREYATENGTALNETLPKLSPLNPQYKTKKKTVFQKVSAFIDKFKGVGGSV